MSPPAALSLAVLQHVKAQALGAADAGAKADLEQALELLSKHAGVSVDSATERRRHGVSATLAEVFAAGCGALGLEPGAKSPLESAPKFVKYLEAVTSKGFFKDVAEGSPAYDTKYLQVMDKFASNFPEAVAEANAAAAAAAKASVGAGAGARAGAGAARSAPAKTPALAASAGDVVGADACKEEGNQLLLKKQYDAAVKKYSEALELSGTGPNSHLYYCNRAAAYFHLENFDKALEDCSVAVALVPDYAKAHARAAQASLKLGDNEGARASAERALELESDNSVAKSVLKAVGSSGAAGGSEMDAMANMMGGMGGMGGMAELLKGMDPAMMQSLSGLAKPGGGMPDIGSLMSNPAVMQMMSNPAFMAQAQKAMQDPQMAAMAQQMAKDPNAMANLMNSMGGAKGKR
jgi:small glutamine-rich tetratricopeptide repeat-containing protein alpha